MSEIIDHLISETVAREHDAIEAVCETMLTDPRGWGVRVDRYPMRSTVALSSEVPFGEIHYRQHAFDDMPDETTRM